MSGEFLRFLAVGALAAGVNIGSRTLFSLWMPFAAAIVPAYACGMVAAFVLNRLFVFHGAAAGDARGQAVRFALVNVAGLAQVWLVGIALAPLLPLLWAHGIAVAVPTVTSYLGHRWFSFARRPVAVEAARR